MRKYHLEEAPIPEGFQIYEERLEVAGVVHRKHDAQVFVRASKKWLEFERDAQNEHDGNAIKVIGCSKRWFGTRRKFLGYVPRDVAERMVKANVDASIKPRLLKTYLGDSGYVEILFQIIGPKRSKPAPAPATLKVGDEPHYSDYVDRVKWLKANSRNNDAIDLLKGLVLETESEAAAKEFGVAHWYYEQLAILYRKEKRYDDEVEILERYASQPKAPGAGPNKLAERLEKARAIGDKKRAQHPDEPDT